MGWRGEWPFHILLSLKSAHVEIKPLTGLRLKLQTHLQTHFGQLPRVLFLAPLTSQLLHQASKRKLKVEFFQVVLQLQLIYIKELLTWDMLRILTCPYFNLLFLSAFLRNCFLCWDRWNGDMIPTLNVALLCRSRVG